MEKPPRICTYLSSVLDGMLEETEIRRCNVSLLGFRKVLDRASRWPTGICRLEPHGKAGRTSRTQVKQETKFRTHVSGRVQLNTQGHPVFTWMSTRRTVQQDGRRGL